MYRSGMNPLDDPLISYRIEPSDDYIIKKTIERGQQGRIGYGDMMVFQGNPIKMWVCMNTTLKFQEDEERYFRGLHPNDVHELYKRSALKNLRESFPYTEYLTVVKTDISRDMMDVMEPPTTIILRYRFTFAHAEILKLIETKPHIFI